MKYKISEDIIEYMDEAKKSFIINPKTGMIFEIDHVASFIIEGIKNNKSQEDIIKNIAEIYPNEDHNNLKTDVDEFFSSLIDNEIILLS